MRSRNLDRYSEYAGMDQENAAPSKNASATLDRRQAERVRPHCRVSYVSEQMCSAEGEGHLEDLSSKGCRIAGVPVPAVGSLTTVSLDLHDGKAPLILPGASVCWSDGRVFGLKFAPLAGEDRQRLQKLVLRYATLQGTSEDHTAFRIT